MRINRIAAFVLIVACGCTSNASAVERPDLLISNVMVVSAENKAAPRRMDVLVHDGRIVAVEEPRASRKVLAVTSIDGTGKYLIPGLIDGHTHLNGIPGMSWEQEEEYPDVAKEARQQIPRSYLFHGFTTVIDLNSGPNAINQWNSYPVRPQAHFCGAAPVVDGYPMSFIPKPARYEITSYFLFDEERADEFPAGIDPARHTPSAVVERIHNDGGICVKTHFEPGFGERRDLPVPSLELVRALVEAAHARDLPVLMHANSELAQSFGNQSGVDAFAHGMWTWNDKTQSAMNAGIERIVEETIETGIALQPTIQVLYGEQDLHQPDYLADPRLRKVIPRSLLDWYRSDAGQWWRKRMLEIPAVAQAIDAGLWQAAIARVSAVTGYFANHGGQLLFGSDTPSDMTFANPPGLNGRIEMDRWIEAGVSPGQLLTAATLRNAEFFNLDDELGTVETGKRADLLLLGMNPLESVSAYDSIEYVVLGGEVFERWELSAESEER